MLNFVGSAVDGELFAAAAVIRVNATQASVPDASVTAVPCPGDVLDNGALDFTQVRCSCLHHVRVVCALRRCGGRERK